MSDHYDKNWQVKYDEDEEKIIIYVKHPPPGFGICPLAELTAGWLDEVVFDDDMKRAKKMAAAPDLLEACKKAQIQLDFMLRNVTNDEQIPYEVLVPLKQAIAKAEN